VKNRLKGHASNRDAVASSKKQRSNILPLLLPTIHHVCELVFARNGIDMGRIK
jgi:hypothetical protein